VTEDPLPLLARLTERAAEAPDAPALVTPAGRVPPDVTLMSMMSYPQCATLLPSGPAVHLSVGG